ncbi:MAG TPA: VIT domain-containing protein, partial [Pirellulales bacterium]|nr:VIT domain-containing protein [Pirellulales bacterium]
MTDQHSNDHDEPQLRSILRALDGDAMPPDHAMLDSLRERTQELFDNTVAKRSVPRQPERELSPAAIAKPSGRRVHILAARGLVAVAGLAAAVAVCLNLIPPGRLSGAMRFSDVLERLRSQQSLELRVTKEGRSAEVWIRAPGSVRWEDSPRRYRIAAGSRLWKIDEAANTVSTGDSPWFIGPKQQVDLLGLLDVGIKDSTPLLAARPVDRAEYDGHDCFVYRVDLAAQDGRVQIAAFADERSKQLVGIVAQLAGAPVAAGPPLAELRLVAVNAPVDESKFVVAKSLTDDGRIGKVSDSQGVVVIRPVLSQRWTPVCREMQLRAGDWLRTDIRGANAVKARLSSEVELTLGPGTLVECVSPALARLHTGEVQVSLPKQIHTEFDLLAPHAGNQKFTEAGKSLFRVDRDEKLVAVKERPKWLAGFEGTSSDESLGSLIVNLPDVGNQPLAVGYHKVSVEIRDQIARTTIEESFVNHTQARLEGVFYFPLPQDASISDFGMWIGNNLVEADVVEKQRAREIYETILRERRDPGLLEWTGGNIFKARVFPIEAQSEKRIKIVYTQVLPLRANRYRYSYGLRSELLRTKPLRELSLTVTVNSALPLKSVTCPTHSARIEHTDHSAQVAFVAQEYIPTRDFEVVCEIDGRQSDVVVVPHRRGGDGYFMVQLTPPAPEGNWQRELVADGKPLELVLLCDTSASMDSEKRKQEAEFVATILSSLGEKDRFWLAAADVGTVWVSKEPMAPTAENVARARGFLDQRMSLGWTNLEQAFEAVLKKAPPGAQVVYIGDGIVTAGEADPDGFVKRLGRLMDRSQSAAERPQCVFHAVTVGNSFESTVLKAIASVGGGSVRSIGGEQTPQSVALELLKEVSEPGLRDLNVEFRGLKVAALYPERLPNLAAGTQQILLGRYLPTGKDQQGEIVVTGHRGSETVRYAAKVDLKDAEEGNSFIPRLWARAHLDHLLAQGQSEAVRDQIIALSEEFHIMTPYTSLLVLETDADRERFGVKRRFAMRDGEQFFAAGRDNANYELTQQQMKRAGDWRIGLRRQVLANLARLGRDSQMFQRQAQVLQQEYERSGGVAGGGGFGGGYGPASGMGGRWIEAGGSGSIAPFHSILQLAVDDSNSYAGDAAIPSGRLLLGDSLRDGDSDALQWGISDRGIANRKLGELDGFDKAELNVEELDIGLNKNFKAEGDVDEFAERGSDFKQNGLEGETTPVDDTESIQGRGAFAGQQFGGWQMDAAGLMPLNRPMSYELNGRMPEYSIGKPFYFGSHGYEQNYTAWLDTLFPTLPPPTRTPQKLPMQPENWSPEAIALARSLLRTESLKKLDGGIELRTVSETFDPRWKRRSSRHSDLALYSPTAWLTRTLDLDAQTIINFCNAEERGVFSLSFLLGRTRKSVERDLTDLPLALSDWSISPLNEAYRGYEAKVAKADAQDQVTLILNTKGSQFEQRFLIDTARHVLLKNETFDQGKLTGSVEFTEFNEVAGSWWARRVTTIDSKRRKTAETNLEVVALAPAKYAERIDAELAAKLQVQFLRLPFAKLKDARQRVADGSAGFDDRIVMMLHDASLQQWDELLKQLEAVEKAAVDKPGVRWLRTIVLQTIRRNEEDRQRLLGEARRLAEKKQQDELYFAGFLLGQAQAVTSPAEYLQFVELLKPVYDRQPDELDAKTRWQEELAGTYDRLGRNDDALALKRILAERAPWDVNKQTDLARRLMQAGQADAAYDWLQKQLDRPEERDNSEYESLRTAYADLYRGQARWEDLLRFTTKSIERKPEYQSAYLQHISALVYNNQLDAANALARQWLKDAQTEGKLSADQE